MNYNNLLRVAGKELNDLKYFLPIKKIPENLIWFLTERCSLKCSHCFVSHKGRKFRDELSVQEIIKVLNSAKAFLKKISFTGGEPMIYQGFDKIFVHCSELPKLKQLHISTNGMHNDKLFQIIEKVKNYKLNIQIQSSLDGLEETHNKIRGNKKSFHNVFDLFKGLDGFKKHNIDKNIVMTCSKENMHEVKEAIDFFSKIEIPLTINFVRSSNDTISEENNDFIPMNDIGLSYEETFNIIELWKNKFKSKMDKYTYTLNLVKMKNLLNFKKNKTWYYDCSAGQSDAVFMSDGSIAICETKKPLGNIKDFDFSYKKFWENNLQTKLKKCHCNFDCAAIYSVNKSIKGHIFYLKEFLFNNN